MTIRVLIADDHAIVREGLKQILGDNPDIFIVGEATDGNDALDKIRGGTWNVVLLDMSMPGRTGLDVLKQVKKEHPEIPVLILSMHPEDQFAVRAIKAGAAGYLTKGCAPEQLMTALLKVSAGGKFITETVADKLVEKLDTDGSMPHENLTDREYQVFSHLAAGRTVSEIAEKMALSVKTVSTHRAKILAKMKMKNNAELMYYGVRMGLQPDANRLEDNAGQ